MPWGCRRVQPHVAPDGAHFIESGDVTAEAGGGGCAALALLERPRGKTRLHDVAKYLHIIMNVFV